MLFRISTIPPLPRPSNSTSSRVAYFNKNLSRRNQYQHRQERVLKAPIEVPVVFRLHLAP
jgi:hypothetical protein